MRPTYPKLSLAPDDDFVLVSGDGGDDAVPPETPTAGEGARAAPSVSDSDAPHPPSHHPFHAFLTATSRALTRLATAALEAGASAAGAGRSSARAATSLAARGAAAASLLRDRAADSAHRAAAGLAAALKDDHVKGVVVAVAHGAVAAAAVVGARALCRLAAAAEATAAAAKVEAPAAPATAEGQGRGRGGAAAVVWLPGRAPVSVR